MNPIQQTPQTEFLSYLIEHQKPVTLHFKDGSKCDGLLTGMTDEVIFFKNGLTECFYKNNISTIIPIAQYTAKT